MRGHPDLKEAGPGLERPQADGHDRAHRPRARRRTTAATRPNGEGRSPRAATKRSGAAIEEYRGDPERAQDLDGEGTSREGARAAERRGRWRGRGSRGGRAGDGRGGRGWRPRGRDRRRRIERRRGGHGRGVRGREAPRGGRGRALGRGDEVHEVLGPHDDRARDLLGQDAQHDLAEANEVALLELRSLDLLAVHEDAVGAVGVADREPVGAGLDHGMPARALHVVQDEVAGGIASEDGEGALELDLVRLSRRGSEPRIAWPSWADSIRGSSRLGSRAAV